MAIGVDTSKYKPRKLQGTPAGKFRNYLGLGVISIGVIIGVIYDKFMVTEKYRQTVSKLYEDPIEEVERKLMIAAGLPNRTGDQIRKEMEESELPDLLYK